MILVDAGPLVALIHADDNHHRTCREVFEALDETMASVWPAVTEAMYLLGFSWKGQEALWQIIERGALSILPLTIDDAARMRELMNKYRDLPMDFADASLVRVAERNGIQRIFTLDHRDFSIYRPQGFERFVLVPARK